MEHDIIINKHGYTIYIQRDLFGSITSVRTPTQNNKKHTRTSITEIKLNRKSKKPFKPAKYMEIMKGEKNENLQYKRY